MILPLMPGIKFFGLSKESYDELPWDETLAGNSAWKWSDNRLITYFPKTSPSNKTTIQISFHPEELETYEAFEGTEDGAGDVWWKSAELGNVEVTMFKPTVEGNGVDADTSTG